MKTKLSFAALALAAAVLAMPVNAEAGFMMRDHAFWKGVDARVHHLMSFDWLCRDEKAVVATKKVRKHRKMSKAKPMK